MHNQFCFFYTLSTKFIFNNQKWKGYRNFKIVKSPNSTYNQPIRKTRRLNIESIKESKNVCVTKRNQKEPFLLSSADPRNYLSDIIQLSAYGRIVCGIWALYLSGWTLRKWIRRTAEFQIFFPEHRRRVAGHQEYSHYQRLQYCIRHYR